MKILQYNVLDGCKESGRYNQLKQLLIQEKYDIAGFNELNDWTQKEFQKEMEKIGFSHSYLFEMKSSPYFLGITAKYPIELIYTEEAAPFHHGLLHVKIRDINIIVTHLSPFESIIRELETKKIAEYIREIKAPLLVMGDLNTLSPLDKEYHNQINMKEKIQNRSFQNRQHIFEGEINYRPMQTLLEAGLKDIGFNGSSDYSMPTKIKGKPENPTYLRIDYMLANSALLQFEPEAEIVHGSEVDTLSDHYPIQCIMKKFQHK
ncbi:endonuclease/exonuclease/phosphatase family protein [Bacillus niameyensis]|uniref:endonuclease/exonuclease/phosphatase family protein n=1 Tax=Bacillus niameyensis TaxID=1522308 RepID=UPI000784B14A|nr:endonuclease/exonuclease/phosphatase family protein [Bacillus niameyensis]